MNRRMFFKLPALIPTIKGILKGVVPVPVDDVVLEVTPGDPTYTFEPHGIMYTWGEISEGEIEGIKQAIKDKYATGARRMYVPVYNYDLSLESIERVPGWWVQLEAKDGPAS